MRRLRIKAIKVRRKQYNFKKGDYVKVVAPQLSPAEDEIEYEGELVPLEEHIPWYVRFVDALRRAWS